MDNQKKIKSDCWGKLLLEFDLGRYFGVTIPQFFLLLAIWIKTTFSEVGIFFYIGVFFIAIIFIWFVGFIILKSGLYKKYQDAIPYPFKQKEESPRVKRRR